ncbi:MAG TPA: hypothetical protein VKZ79_01440 [Alphaproteobacteria bacterium]|nr:hypothetical protein [Alphaproteobacteria bacterium]
MDKKPDFGLKVSLAACALASLASGATLAADAGGSAGATEQSSQTIDPAVIKELQKKIDQRDVIIRNLLARVERLERQEAARTAGAPSTGNSPSGAPPQQAKAAAPSTAQAPANPPAQASAESGEQTEGTSSSGSFTVSEEAAQHALERALVQTGAALLPSGVFEFVPSLIYQSQRTSFPGQIALSSSGTVLITEDVTRKNILDADALLRVGLPWDTQAEVSLPYEYNEQSVATRALGSGISERSLSVQGIGNPAVTLVKQLIHESDLDPGLFLAETWNSNFGMTNRIALGNGFNQFTTALTAVKRQDPLVFTASLGYQTTLSHDGIRLGDQFLPSVGVLLAVSPETSLRFAQQLGFVGKTSLHGKLVPGTEQTIGFFSAGLLSILDSGLVMELNTSIGETRDSPDFVVELSFPIRF